MTIDDVKESAAMAIDTVRANKLRSSLTILGVSVGVITVIFMVSIIQGLNKAFADQIESLGYSDKQTDTPVLLGVTQYYEFVHSQTVSSGRFINEIDLEHRSDVCVVGVDVMRALFPYENPLDKEIKMNGTTFRVIGVMEPLGNFFGQSRDNIVFIPISAFDKYYPDLPAPQVVFFVVLRPMSRAYVKQAMEEITDILRRRRHVPAGAPNNFGMSSQDSLLDIYNQLTGATALVLTAVSFFPLILGGIGR